MAANSQTHRLAHLGKRLVTLTRPKSPAPTHLHPASAAARRRDIHASAYDKNLDDQVCPEVVPDHVIPQSEKYWAPHPHTGVFGPATDGASGGGGSPAWNGGGGDGSALDLTARFRHLENLEKPLPEEAWK